jgi:hypothetical protein
MGNAFTVNANRATQSLQKCAKEEQATLAIESHQEHHKVRVLPVHPGALRSREVVSTARVKPGHQPGSICQLRSPP